MDARCTPSWILRHHLEDQVTDLFGDPTATADSFSRSAEHGPIQLEPSLVPPHHCLWENENERFFPVGPETARHDPEESIEWTQPSRNFSHGVKKEGRKVEAVAAGRAIVA